MDKLPYTKPVLTKPHRFKGGDDVVALLHTYGKEMTGNEARKLLNADAKTTTQLKDRFEKTHSNEALAALAQIGQAHSKWYQEAAEDLTEKFGKDAPRFTALLAATSGNKGVKENIRAAAYIWSRYTKLRKQLGHDPSLPEITTLVKSLNDEARYEGGIKKSYGVYATQGTDLVNIKYALDPNTDPGDVVKKILGGDSSFKLDSFRKNLLGNLFESTNDVWHVKAMGQPNTISKNKQTGVVSPSYEAANGPEYGVYSAKTRQVAKLLGIQPAEAQAALWQAVRQIAIYRERSRQWSPGMKEKHFQETGQHIPNRTVTGQEAAANLSNEDITRGASFSNLLSDPEVEKHIGKSTVKPREIQNPTRRPYENLTPERREAVNPVLKEYEAWNLTPQNISRNAKQGRLYRFAAQGRQADGGVTPPPASPVAVNRSAPMTAPAQVSTVIGASPNVQQGLGFEQALQRTRSGNQKAFNKVLSGITEGLGLKAKTQDAVGDWNGDVENSIYQHINHEQGHSPEISAKTRYAAAWYGQLANQQSVMLFHSDPKGPDSLYEIELPSGDLQRIRKELDKYGVKDRTLIPGKKGTRIIILDPGRKLKGNVQRLAGAMYANVSESSGQGEYIGASTRTGARAAYRQIIEDYENQPEFTGKSGGLQEKREAVLGDYGRASTGKSLGAGNLAFSRRGHKVKYFRAWIDPQGNIHEVPGNLTHSEWARAYQKTNNPNSKFPVKDLVKSGWGRVIDSNKDLYFDQPHQGPTEAQKNSLVTHAQKNNLDNLYHVTLESEKDPLLWSRPKQLWKQGTKVRFSGVQSPMGGVIVRGVFYPGGKYIPKAELEKSNWKQYEQVRDRRSQLEKYNKARRPDGSIDSSVALKYAKEEEEDEDEGMAEAGEAARHVVGMGKLLGRESLKAAGSLGRGIKSVASSLWNRATKIPEATPVAAPPQATPAAPMAQWVGHPPQATPVAKEVPMAKQYSRRPDGSIAPPDASLKYSREVPKEEADASAEKFIALMKEREEAAHKQYRESYEESRKRMGGGHHSEQLRPGQSTYGRVYPQQDITHKTSHQTNERKPGEEHPTPKTLKALAKIGLH